VDDKGRLKIPSGFLHLIETNFGPDFFITSLSGESVRVYPMEVWLDVERRLAAIPSSNPSKARFLDRVHFFGQAASMDKQGRVLIPAHLRESAQMNGSVDVLGKFNLLEIWNHERFLKKLEDEPLTEEDLKNLAEMGL
jgi:MraZ protein